MENIEELQAQVEKLQYESAMNAQADQLLNMDTEIQELTDENVGLREALHKSESEARRLSKALEQRTECLLTLIDNLPNFDVLGSESFLVF